MEKRHPNMMEEINAAYGKLPPQAINAEMAVLGALILESHAYTRVARIIKPRSFYKEEHVKICEAVKAISDKHIPIDIVVVTQYLKDHDKLDEVGGPGYIMELTRNVSSAAHLEHHAKIVAQKFMQREIIRISSETQKLAYDDTQDVGNVLHHMHSSLNNIETDISNSILTPKDGMKMIEDRIKKNLTQTSGVTGLPIGLRSIDNFMGGMQDSDLVILAAERSQGKTSFLITILNHLGGLGIPASLISFEMSFIQLLARMISQETSISGKKILSQQLQSHEIADIEKCSVKDMSIYIDDDCPNSLSGVLNSIRFLKNKYGVRCFGIDYMQLMKVDSINRITREEELGTIARELKNIAKELDVVIIALSQLNRGEKRGQEPELGRLRGSGQIEDAADTIIFIHRPETYDVEFMDDTNYESSSGRALVNIAKGRNIGTEKFVIKFTSETGRFHEDADFDEGFPNPDAFIEGTSERY